MAPRNGSTASSTNAPSANATPGEAYETPLGSGTQVMGWTPPKAAEKRELADFVRWETLGDVVIGRIQRGSYRERPDDLNPGKMMKSLTLAPAILLPNGGQPDDAIVSNALALGLSAHLELLLPRAATGGHDGECIAVVYDGDRAPQKRGQNPGRQFVVYHLSEKDFNGELAKFSRKDQHPLPF